MRAHALVVVFSLLPTLALAEEAQPSYEQLLEHAHRAAEASQFLVAVQDLERAYALRQDPQLLLDLARGHRRLGHAKETADYYQRFRLASGPLSSELTIEIDSALRIVTPAPLAVAAAVAYANPLTKTITRPGHGLLIGGATLFATAYSAAAISGGAFAVYGGQVTSYNYNGGFNGNTDYGNSKTAGGLLFIPFLGPFLSAIADRDPTWVGPWVAVDGGMQLLGLCMMIASRYSPETIRVLAKVPRISPYASATGGGATLALRF